MRKIFLATVVLTGVVGCDTHSTKKTTEDKYNTTVEKPATVTEKHTTQVDVDE